MTRLLYLYGDTKLAKRTLNLYIQVVGKAYETSGHRSESDSGSESGEDTDTDSNWVDTLIFGSTMLCTSSFSFNPTEMDDLNEAHKIIDKAKTRLNKEDKRLVAKMYLAEGVYWMMLGVRGWLVYFLYTFDQLRVIFLNKQAKIRWLDKHISHYPIPSSYNPYRQIQRQAGITTSLSHTLSQGVLQQLRHKDPPVRLPITLTLVTPNTTSTKQFNTPV
jgi:hypothetical protein